MGWALPDGRGPAAEYGYDVRPTTPALQRWAQSAVTFERAYSSSSWTLPAFGTILTGVWPSVHGAGAYRLDGEDSSWAALDETLVTLPEVFRGHGYATAAIVNNLYLNERFGVARGFDSYDWRNGSGTWFAPPTTRRSPTSTSSSTDSSAACARWGCGRTRWWC